MKDTTKKKPVLKSTPAPQVNEKSIEDLAEKIAAVLSHPACPPLIYDELTSAINECVSSIEINHYPGYLAAILIEHAKGGE
jgi:hypothetical protein